VIFWKYSDQIRRSLIDLFRLWGTKVITVAFAPLLVMFRKGLQRLAAYTVHMPVGVDKIHPFLGAITAGRAVKEVIGSGIGLIQKGNDVLFHSSFLVHIKAELPIHCFELISCFIHTSILLQFCPAVKSITRDFFRIRFICLWSTQRVIPEIPDQDGIDSADKDASVREPVGNRFIVSAGMLHTDFSFAVKAFDLLHKSIDSRLGVRNVTRRHENYIAGPADGD